jgi:hypothetical protein
VIDMDESTDRHARLAAHSADCDECREAPLPLDHIAACLDTAVPVIDASTLSRRTFARLQPELRRCATLIGWRRVAICVLLASLPLPFVLAYNAYLLRLAYDFLSALLPATLAAYLVLSYAAFLVLLFATTYAAIPLLVVQRPIERPPAPA